MIVALVVAGSIAQMLRCSRHLSAVVEPLACWVCVICFVGWSMMVLSSLSGRVVTVLGTMGGATARLDTWNPFLIVVIVTSEDYVDGSRNCRLKRCSMILDRVANLSAAGGPSSIICSYELLPRTRSATLAHHKHFRSFTITLYTLEA